jgi:hypothetical protein
MLRLPVWASAYEINLGASAVHQGPEIHNCNEPAEALR